MKEKEDKKRIRPVVSLFSALLALGALTLGTTMALFWASSTSSSQQFAAGTVSIGDGAADVTCAVTNLMPGDSSTGWATGSKDRTQCTYNVEYTGSAPAYLAVDIAVSNGSTALYSGANGLQLKVKGGSHTFVDGTSYTPAAGGSATLSASTPVTNFLLSTTPASTGDTASFTIDYMLPLISPNAFQGGSSSIVLTFHAVQSANQSASGCVAGSPCSAVSWS